MKPRLVFAVAILLSLRAPASAHRLNEYLQATILSVEKDQLQASMRLVPGVAVSSAIVGPSIPTPMVSSQPQRDVHTQNWYYAIFPSAPMAMSCDLAYSPSIFQRSMTCERDSEKLRSSLPPISRLVARTARSSLRTIINLGYRPTW